MGQMFYKDSTGALIPIGTNIAQSSDAQPAGIIAPFAGSTVPYGWMLCAGQAVSRTAYPALFAAIGTTYGTGDGSTTFNLPDLRGRVPAGLDNMGGTDAGRLDWANTLGTPGGAQKHTLSLAEIPSHNHNNITGVNNQDHWHGQIQATVASGGGMVVGVASNGSGGAANGITTGASGTHNHNIAAEGGGGAHNNMQPTILLNYIISIGIGSGISKPVGCVVYGSSSISLPTTWTTLTWTNTSFNDAGVTGGTSIYRLTPGTWDIQYDVMSDLGTAGGAYFELLWRDIGGSWNVWYEGKSSLHNATGYAGCGVIRNKAMLRRTWTADFEIAVQGYAYNSTRTVTERELIMWKLG